MTLRWLAASIHLLALVVGAAAIAVRAFALRRSASGDALHTVFAADSFWGLAALLWIASGAWRAFGTLEKSTAYYLGSTAFWVKMGLLAGILALEVRPMNTLIRWRIATRRGESVDLRAAAALARISTLQLLLVGAMVVVAAAMARGLWS